MKSILIVDDSFIVRSNLRALLEQNLDWKICGEAENGRDAIQQAAQLHPDLVVLDLSMPIMNGLEAGRAIKRLLPDVHMVMWSSFAIAVAEREATAAGFELVLCKSDDSFLLIDGIQRLLERDPAAPHSIKRLERK